MRKTMLTAVLTLAMAAPALAGGGQDRTEQGAGGAGNPPPAAQDRGLGLPALPKDEKALLERLHADSQMELQASQLAQQKATHPGVKDLARRLVSDHTAMDQEVMAYAQQKGLKLGAPKPMNDAEKAELTAKQATLDTFRLMPGGKVWDQSYLAEMVKEHDKSAAKLTAAQQQFANNPQLAQMAKKNLPTIVQHREQAYRLLGELRPEAMGVGGAGGAGRGQGATGTQQPGTQQPGTRQSTPPQE